MTKQTVAHTTRSGLRCRRHCDRDEGVRRVWATQQKYRAYIVEHSLLRQCPLRFIARRFRVRSTRDGRRDASLPAVPGQASVKPLARWAQQVITLLVGIALRLTADTAMDALRCGVAAAGSAAEMGVPCLGDLLTQSSSHCCFWSPNCQRLPMRRSERPPRERRRARRSLPPSARRRKEHPRQARAKLPDEQRLTRPIAL